MKGSKNYPLWHILKKQLNLNFCIICLKMWWFSFNQIWFKLIQSKGVIKNSGEKYHFLIYDSVNFRSTYEFFKIFELQSNIKILVSHLRKQKLVTRVIFFHLKFRLICLNLFENSVFFLFKFGWNCSFLCFGNSSPTIFLKQNFFFPFFLEANGISS